MVIYRGIKAFSKIYEAHSVNKIITVRFSRSFSHFNWNDILLKRCFLVFCRELHIILYKIPRKSTDQRTNEPKTKNTKPRQKPIHFAKSFWFCLLIFFLLYIRRLLLPKITTYYLHVHQNVNVLDVFMCEAHHDSYFIFTLNWIVKKDIE